LPGAGTAVIRRGSLRWIEAERRANVAVAGGNPLLIPGLVPDRRLRPGGCFEAWRSADSDDELEHQLVSGRMERASRSLSVPPAAGTMGHRRPEGVAPSAAVGSGKKIMHDQLMHLADTARSAQDHGIQVVPGEVGAHVGLLGRLRYSERRRRTEYRCTWSHPTRGQTTQTPSVVAKVQRKTFDTLRAEALRRGVFADLIRESS